MVVAAQHLQLKQRVAIKFLLSSAAKAEDTIARFVREAQAAARIQSEYVARVLDVATLEGGVPYMVMEVLEGEDLAQLLAKRGPLPWMRQLVTSYRQLHNGSPGAHSHAFRRLPPQDGSVESVSLPARCSTSASRSASARLAATGAGRGKRERGGPAPDHLDLF